MSDYTSLDIGTSDLVYMPSEDTELAAGLLAEYLGEEEDDNLAILDMGTGTGALGLTAAMSRKAGSVLFADKDVNALELAKRNVLMNREMLHAKCSFVRTDLFSDIGAMELFDVMVFNPPYLPPDGDRSPLEDTWNGGKDGIEVTMAFIEGARRRLRRGGAILTVVSSLSNEESVYALADSLGLSVRNRRSVHIFFEDITAVLFIADI